MFSGSFCALITPFKNNKIDETALEKLIEWQIQEGIHGLVPCGTTGESPTLSHEEHKRIIELTISVSSGRVPVLAGTGSNSTDEAISLTRHAMQVGADGALVVTPYYNKPTQLGLTQHYLEIANSVTIPIIIYNIPGRSVIDMSLQTMCELADHSNIVGVKDASNDVARVSRLNNLLDGREFCQLSGEDPTLLGFLAHGGVGIISVTANVAPKKVAQIINFWKINKLIEAQDIHLNLMPLNDALFSETSPGPIKYAASQLNLCEYQLRLPLTSISKVNEKKVIEALKFANLKN